MAIPKRKKISATRKHAAGGFMLGMFVGLIAGLAVSLAIAFYLNKTPVPFLSAKAKQAEKDASKAPAIAALPQGAVAAVPAEKPKFDFYKILPGQEEPVSERELRDRMKSGRGQQDGPKRAEE